MKTFTSLILSCAAMLCSPAAAEKVVQPRDTYTSRYFLDFSLDSARLARSSLFWARPGHGYSTLFHSRGETVRLPGGRTCLTFHDAPLPGLGNLTPVLRLDWEQHLPLPAEARTQPVEVTLRSRGKGLSGVTLAATLVDTAEQPVVRAQTVGVPGDALASYTVTLPTHTPADALWLSLKVEGRNERPAEVGLERVDIRVGGKPLDSYALPQPEALSLASAPEPVSQLWPSLEGRSVVALGGSSAWNGREAVAIAAAIGADVRRGHTRAVVVDRPMERTFTMNRYVCGMAPDPAFDWESDATIRPLLDTLRACNQAAGEVRVRVVGGRVAVNFGREKSSTGTDLFDFIVTANATTASPRADLLATIAYEEGAEATLAYWEAQPDALDGVLTADEQADVRHLLDLWRSLPADIYAQLLLNDSTLGVNVRYVSSRYAAEPGARTIVCGRSAEANPTTGYPLTTGRPWGNYLHEAYGEDYAAVAVTSEGGRTLVVEPPLSRWSERPLSPAPTGSLERALADMTDGMAYLPATALPDTPVLMRAANGRADGHGFFRCNPHGRYAGVLFVGKDVPMPSRYLNPNRMSDPSTFRATTKRREQTLKRIHESETYRAYKQNIQ